jgi:O-antigen/teichoic acid export membrane protein
MVGFITNDVEVGIYSAANKLNKMILGFVSAATTVFLPRMSYYAGINDHANISNLLNKGFNALLLFSIPAAVGLFVLSEPLVLILCGENYYPAIIVMKMLTPIIILISISGLIGIQYFIPLGKEKITLISVAAGAILNFTLNLFLIARYGALGAGISTLFVETLITFFQLFFAKTVLYVKNIIINFLQFLFASVFMGIIVYIIQAKINTQIYKIIISIPTGILLYSLILIVFRNYYAVLCLSAFKDKLYKLRYS